MLMKWSSMWLSHKSYGVYVGITGCARLLRDVRGNLPVLKLHDVEPVTATQTP